MEETVTIILDGKGNLEIETDGFKGKICEKVANEILVGMNGTTNDSGRKAAYYEDGDNPVEILSKS